MFIVNSYPLAVIFCFITMMCWGSWGNTQKLAAKSWRYELFYWDYVIGMLLFSLLISFTMGSFGSQGRPFIEDLAQADAANIWSVILGGIIFNASNILLSASTSIAGMSVAFPLGVGLSLVLGVIVNWLGSPKGDPVILFTGVALIAIAIICNGIASGKMQKGKDTADSGRNRKGIILAVIAGVLMSFFYRFVAKAMDLDNFENPAPGMLTPYSAIFIFSVGVFLSNFIFNTLVMRHPFIGERVYYKGVFRRQLQDPPCRHARRRHLVPRHSLQLHSLRQGRSRHLLCPRPGCPSHRRHLGRIHLERIQRRRQRHLRPPLRNVPLLHRRPGSDHIVGRKLKTSGAECGKGGGNRTGFRRFCLRGKMGRQLEIFQNSF